MRIVDRKAFLEYPAGTIYARYEPSCFGEVQIKDSTYRDTQGKAIDWAFQDLIPWFQGCKSSLDYIDCLQTIENGTPSPPLDYDTTGRDGCFETNQLFAIFEGPDVRALIERLFKAYHDAYDTKPHTTTAAA